MNAKNLSQLPQLFRSPFLRKVALGYYYKELAERLEVAGLSGLLRLRLSDIFEAVYEVLLNSYRCEYVFKNTLLKNWFLSRHSTDSSFITDEFRVGESRVDLALFSRTSVAFEIKTEFDSPKRLMTQSKSYMKAFDLIYVVTTSNMLPKLAIPNSVGILQLETSGCFKTIRNSESHSYYTDLITVFNCLRQAERIAIIKKTCTPINNVPNSEIYNECRRRFRSLIPFEAQRYIVQQIRMRSYSIPAVTSMSQVPEALKHAALTLRATNQDTKRISEELKMIPKNKDKKNTYNYEHIFPISARKTERVACAS